MTALTVLKFNTEDGADQALNLVQNLAKQNLITVEDAAIVAWPMGKKKPKTKQLTNMAGIGALHGAFWGLLFGLLFFRPFLGLAIGAATGALAGMFTDVGIDDDFIKSVQDKVTEGTSALFLLTSQVIVDRVIPAMQSLDFELIASNLSKEQEEKLRAAFGAEGE
jgi:uncharacterized membrane protein